MGNLLSLLPKTGSRYRIKELWKRRTTWNESLLNPAWAFCWSVRAVHVGIGNVWKFPYVVGQNGGGWFVLLYLLFLVIMGLPVLTMELAVGRASRKSAVLGYKALEKPGSKWHIHGWFAIFGCYMLMMYYTTVSGWMLNYFVKFATGAFYPRHGVPRPAERCFRIMLANPVEMGLWMAHHRGRWAS